MTTLEDMERIALRHAMLAIREHEERLAALASPAPPGARTAVGQEAAAPCGVGAGVAAPAPRAVAPAG